MKIPKNGGESGSLAELGAEASEMAGDHDEEVWAANCRYLLLQSCFIAPGTYNKHTSEEIHSYHKRVRYGDFVLCEVLVCVCVCVCVCVAAACLNLLQNC